MIRIGAAITAVVMIVLLAVVGWPDSRTDLVVPTGGVTDGGPVDAVPAGKDALGIFGARTQRQEFRNEPLSAEALQSSSGQTLAAEPGSRTPGAAQVSGWWAAEPTDYGILRDREDVTGISPTIPDPRAPVLIQSGGRDWRNLHNDPMTYGGAWLLFGGLLAMAVFLLIRGRVTTAEPFTGRSVRRFSGFERGTHWFTAASFVMLGLTGLILLYGQYILKPWMGAGAFSTLAAASIYVHIAFTVAFVVGLLVMLVIWARENLPHSYDWKWLRMGFGNIVWRTRAHPPAERFNAGQKLWYWFALIAGALMLASGVSLMFPFFWFDVNAMQWTMAVHSALGLIFIAVSFGHIYIGTVGMRGAIDAMWSGDVDTTWAREHHSLWAQDIGLDERAPQSGKRRTAAAE